MKTQLTQWLQSLLGVCAITAVTFLTAIGKLDASTAVVVILGGAGITIQGVTSAHVTDSTYGNTLPPAETPQPAVTAVSKPVAPQ